MTAKLSAGQKNLMGEEQGFIFSDGKKPTSKPREYQQERKKKTGLDLYQEG